MKCPSCGGEIKEASKFCEFCGSQITLEMQKEREQLNKKGCPECGSTNVTFNREKQGEVKGKNKTAVVRSTVGYCKDCGYTWKTKDDAQPKKKGSIWLWVLGWICIFPVPLTILMLRTDNKLDKKIRYGIIVAAWVAYLLIALCGNGGSPASSSTTDARQETVSTEEIKTENPKEDITEAVSGDESTTSVQPESSEETTTEDSSSGIVDADLKAFLDSYEEFMDDYCDFMEKYDSSDATMLVEYTEMMAKYTEFVKKADAYDSDKMSEADSQYYIEVMTRVNVKLQKVAYTN